MSNNQWQTIICEKNCKLFLKNGNLAIRKDNDEIIQTPLSQIKTLLIESSQVELTSALISRMALENIGIIFCDEKKMPSSIVMPICNNVLFSERIQEQIKWEQKRKDLLWQSIIKNKIKNQILALELLDIKVPTLLNEYYDNVLSGDSSNREGLASKIYFRSIFGNNFIRHSSDEINYSLNYGYSILYSGISRLVSLHGYCGAIGIHHISSKNKWNLSSDLMEVFRPFVDISVFINFKDSLNKELKQKLIEISSYICKFNNFNYTIDDAQNEYLLNNINYLNNISNEYKEIII